MDAHSRPLPSFTSPACPLLPRRLHPSCFSFLASPQSSRQFILRAPAFPAPPPTCSQLARRGPNEAKGRRGRQGPIKRPVLAFTLRGSLPGCHRRCTLLLLLLLLREALLQLLLGMQEVLEGLALGAARL
jgi:hypothetical protein